MHFFVQAHTNRYFCTRNGTEDFHRFNLSEHAGLCTAGAPLIGASIIACYATASLAASGNATGGQGSPASWEIDERQEHLIEQWAKIFNLPNLLTLHQDTTTPSPYPL